MHKHKDFLTLIVRLLVKSGIEFWLKTYLDVYYKFFTAFFVFDQDVHVVWSVVNKL